MSKQELADALVMLETTHDVMSGSVELKELPKYEAEELHAEIWSLLSEELIEGEKKHER